MRKLGTGKGSGAWPNNVERHAGYDSRHSSDVITDLSLAWLEQRDRSRPFFLGDPGQLSQ